jgi:L-ribulose-5-phosphate 3-epimerase
MDRRTFLSAASSVVISDLILSNSVQAQTKSTVNPFQLGLMIKPTHGAPETPIRLVHDLGLRTCFLLLNDYVNNCTPQAAKELKDLLTKYEVVCTTVEVVGPPPHEWNFLRGPSTIGLVPKATRAARIDALRQVSDFAKLLGVEQVQTHCGFIPEDPSDPKYHDTVEAVRTVAQHCQKNGQFFLLETGQETPTTMSRMLRDAAMPNLAVGLDTANLILYGKANPVDAVDILGPHVRSIHAKDGKWPTDPDQLGEEVLMGKGLVDFRAVFTKLHKLGYTGAVTIERETSGPQQIEDVKLEKRYLEGILSGLLA